MAWPASFSGKSYVAIWRAMFDAAQRERGGLVIVEEPTLVADLGTSHVPELTNAQAIGLVTAWNHAGARGNVPDDEWRIWRRWALRLQQWALGWLETGDRFVVDEDGNDKGRKNAAAPYAGQLGALWAATLALAQSLDRNSTTPRALPFSASYAAYEASARESWRQMQDAAARGAECESCLEKPYETDPACDDCGKAATPAPLPTPLPTRPTRDGKGSWLWIAVAIGVAIAASE